MNERIKELAEQCYMTYRNGHGGYTEQFDEEKFAELIIKRCVQTLIDNTPNDVIEEDWDKGYDQAMKDCVHHIQEHFGIE